MYYLWLHSLYNGRASCKRPFGLLVLKYSASKILGPLQKTFASLYSRTLVFDAQFLKSYHWKDVPNEYNGEIFFPLKRKQVFYFLIYLKQEAGKIQNRTLLGLTSFYQQE